MTVVHIKVFRSQTATTSGAGAELGQPTGVAVFSGMLGVTLFGMGLTPNFYYVIGSCPQVASRRANCEERDFRCPTKRRIDVVTETKPK
jgi:hypothetical protein